MAADLSRAARCSRSARPSAVARAAVSCARPAPASSVDPPCAGAGAIAGGRFTLGLRGLYGPRGPRCLPGGLFIPPIAASAIAMRGLASAGEGSCGCGGAVKGDSMPFPSAGGRRRSAPAARSERSGCREDACSCRSWRLLELLRFDLLHRVGHVDHVIGLHILLGGDGIKAVPLQTAGARRSRVTIERWLHENS